MLAAHYDSVPAGPGAGDDAHGVAVILETMRALSTQPPLPNDVVVLITDAEEEGLFGARAFVSAHAWAKDVSVVLNFEARGSTGPAAMFEVTRQNGFLVDALAHAGVRRPVATSLTGEVYRRMPNDTDLTVFARAGMAGMNFAFADGVARYHTARDRPEELDPRSVQHQLDYALPLVRALGAADLATPRAPDRVYFAVGSWLVRYPARFALGLAIAVSGAFALLLGADVRRGLVRVQDVALAAVAVLTFVLLGGAVGILVEQLAQLVARDPVRARGIDSLAPDVERLGLALAVVAVVGLALAELARRLPPPAVVRGALAPVALLALLVAFTAPGASHVLVWPVAAATAALALEQAGNGTTSWRAIASSVLAAVPAFFWAGLVQVLFIVLGLAGAGGAGGVLALGVASLAPAFVGASTAPHRVRVAATLAAFGVLGVLLAVAGAVSAARA